MSAEHPFADGSFIDAAADDHVFSDSHPSSLSPKFSFDKIPRWTRELHLTAETRDLIEHMCKTSPVRKPTGNGNVTGYYASNIMYARIPWSSRSAELGFLWRAHHPAAGTRLILSEPIYLRITTELNGGKDNHSYNYPPDYFWMTDRWAGFVECKWEHEIKRIIHPENPKGKPGMFVMKDGRWSCPPGEAAAKALGLGFVVFVMKQSEVQLSNNLEVLADYHDEPKGNYLSDVAQRIKKIVDDSPGIQIREIQDRLQDDEIDTLFFLLARRELYVDFARQPLAPNYTTPVYRDAVVASAATRLSELPIDRNLLTSEFDVRTGTAFLLRGEPAKIMGVVDDVVTIEHGDTHEEMMLEQLERLVASNEAKLVEGPAKSMRERGLAEYYAAREQWPRMLRREELIRPFLNARTQYQRKQLPPKTRTIYRYLTNYHTAEEKYGPGLGMLGLRDKQRLGNPQRQLDPAVIAIMDDVIDNYWAKTPGRNKEVSWGEVRRRCKKHRLNLQSPSRTAFYAQLRRNSAEKEDEYIKSRYGEKVAYAMRAAVWEDDWDDLSIDGEHAWAVSHIDHTQVDCETPLAADGLHLGRPWFTVMVSPRYRRILAVTLSYEPPSYRSCMQVIRECVQRHNRLPRVIVTDGGKEFRSDYFGALLLRFGITQKLRPARKPRFGAVLERLNLTITSKLFHNLAGNTLAMKDPRSVSASHNPRRLAIYSLPTLADLVREFCYNYLDTQAHHLNGVTPRDAFKADMRLGGPRSHKIVLYNEDFILLTLPTTKRRYATASPRQGFVINRIPYWCREAKERENRGHKFSVKYDPEDFSKAWVLIDGKWRLCYSREFRYRFKGLSEKEIRIATTELLGAAQTLKEKRRAINATTLADFFAKNCDRSDVKLARTRAAENKAARAETRVGNARRIPKPALEHRQEHGAPLRDLGTQITASRRSLPKWTGFGGIS
ncbi:Mu transposase C-terminal domain-containing protein [Opitutus terrae]|uniref:Integrase catalytic region n=1 Tax=Opitutus terrae (strain DSM 11246 / JCM 15787 / PB90-1) TaxID=452637 RepID=B1ZSH7_OPITP|nr:Mu transposase C-terminal domain-containing protein [Opitutus terrae]ACB73834.1 Integrase catalytic region [Opitutus terrae PB90-1]